MSIRNIIFDIGKVLVSYEPEECMIRLGFDETERAEVNRALFGNEIWEMADGGSYGPRELLEKAVAQNPSYEKQITTAWEHVGDAIELLPYALDWILEYKKQGYQVYIISNYSEHTLNLTREKLKFLPYMDGVIFSYAEKLLKPDHRIYELLLERYSLKAEECLFFDDREENVAGAEDCGIHAILFTDIALARQKAAEFMK